ncbi:MAG: Maf family nucleotide pyrophosphatase [Bacteroidota bacterium]
MPLPLPPDFDPILASKSPRRSQLLTQAGIPFRIRTKEVEEDYPEDLAARDVAPFLARKKALACADYLENDQQILLTADSVVILNDRIYGKPEDREDAIRIISELSGNVHTVVTGVCLLSKRREEVFSGISDVYFRKLSGDEITYYVDKYQPFDKAGAYAIQEWIGLCKIHRIDGTYDNIMGLPVDLVYEKLTDGGWRG